MPQMILRVVVALVAFGAGVMASTLFGAVFGSPAGVSRDTYIRQEPLKRRPCPNSYRSMSELPPPVSVAPDVAPLPDVPPPPPKPTFRKRITVKLPDGTVRVIESGAETVERKR